jgi:flagellar biosynthesis/type III secretory pathway protein FliH
VRRVLGVERITIRVHPHDLAAVREQKSAIQANGDSIREIVVEADEGLEPGDSVLESDMGNIDARIATQLKQIENMLFEGRVVS